jgi:transcriptional regulator with XRE-family HTH domain
MTTVGQRVKAAREAAGLGLNELDARIDSKSGYTSRIESGDRLSPRLEKLRLIAEATGVDPGWLITGEGSMKAGSGAQTPTRSLDLEERYPQVAIVFADARSSGKYSEELLKAAAARLGVFKTEPTHSQIWDAIEAAVRGKVEAEERYARIHQRAAVPPGEPLTEAEKALHRAPKVVTKKKR